MPAAPTGFAKAKAEAGHPKPETRSYGPPGEGNKIMENNQRGRGRPPGSLNKVNAELKALAQEYTGEALAVLVGILRDGSDTNKLVAVREILDRGHGKPTQSTDVTSLGERVGRLIYPGLDD